MQARWLAAWVAIAWPLDSSAEPAVLVWPRAPAEDVAPAEAAARAAGWKVIPFGPVGARLREVAARETVRAGGVRASASATLQAVQRAYLDQKYDDMLAALEALERDALEVVAAAADPTPWEIEVHAGIAHLARAKSGDAEQARTRFRRALSLDPGRRPPADVYGPAVARAFADVQNAARAEGEVDVVVESEPSDAHVVIDQVALTSRRVRLRPGPHLVYARAPGYRPTSRWITIGPGALTLPLEPDAGDEVERLAPPWERGELRPDAPSGRRALLAAAARLGAELVVVVESVPAGGSARVVSARQGGAPVVKASMAAAARAALAPLRALPQEVVPTPPRTGDEPTPLYRRWWLWAGAAAVVAGAIAITLVVSDEPDRLELYAPP